jgi:hypothetical protein
MTTTYAATATASANDWNSVGIEIATDPECPEVVRMTTTAHDFTHACEEGGEVPFDGDQWAADIDAALRPEWIRVSDITNDGGYTDAFTVAPASDVHTADEAVDIIVSRGYGLDDAIAVVGSLIDAGTTYTRDDVNLLTGAEIDLCVEQLNEPTDFAPLD